MFWRENGKQRSLSFADEDSAQRFQTNVTVHGPAEALRLVEIAEAGVSVMSLVEWLRTHCDSLTGIEDGSVKRYRRYIDLDIEPFFDAMPIVAVTENSIGKWVQWMAAKPGRKVNGEQRPISGKTIQNKHGFLSGALNAAVAHKPPIIESNPCLGRKLPTTVVEDMVFLEPEEFMLIHDCITQERYRKLALWLVSTGMRFSEATALEPRHIDPKTKIARVRQAWKYAPKRGDVKLGAPKTKRSRRDVSVPQSAIDALDLTAPGYLFTNGVGNPVRAQEFYNLAWKPARDAAIAQGLTKVPRVHDLRHTAASWWIQDGVPLAVVQAQLGHESITTTVNRYGHIDRRSADIAASAMDRRLTSGKPGDAPEGDDGGGDGDE
ncbi:tyrosine-type recombinase/integrase [Mycolicibacter heraklionensis]|uniref:tyrosine-type recombinase/integrase n=1 Tax=Mycolicibacter heraklionensis TaxID=512402 RepID=UPI0006993C25|nr:site-specific integrase [Mycolicibacter heraklionensis]